MLYMTGVMKYNAIIPTLIKYSKSLKKTFTLETINANPRLKIACTIKIIGSHNIFIVIGILNNRSIGNTIE